LDACVEIYLIGKASSQSDGTERSFLVAPLACAFDVAVLHELVPSANGGYVVPLMSTWWQID